MARLKGRQMKTRIKELRNATQLSGGAGLTGPTVSVKLGKTTTQELSAFVTWLQDKGVLIEGYDYEIPGAVARSVEGSDRSSPSSMTRCLRTMPNTRPLANYAQPVASS